MSITASTGLPESSKDQVSQRRLMDQVSGERPLATLAGSELDEE